MLSVFGTQTFDFDGVEIICDENSICCIDMDGDTDCADCGM